MPLFGEVSAGTIICPTGGLIRHAEFAQSLEALVKPFGTRTVFPSHGSVGENLNRALRELDDSDWVWLLADDHVFHPNLLMDLLAKKQDVIVPLCAKRTPPYRLVVGGETTIARGGREYPALQPVPLEDVPDSLFQVELAGTAGMLIRREVIDEVGDPRFESTDGLYMNEDFTFCQKVRAKGYDICVDPNSYLGHIGAVQIWPTRHEGRLAVKLDYGDPNNPILLADHLITVSIGG